MRSVSGAGVQGYLRLHAGLNAVGRTAILRQEICAPMHLSKPYLDGETLIVNAINQTAGLFSGDRVECSAEVGEGANVLITSPSATRVYRATGERVVLEQTFRVANGAWLEVNPELFIPQSGANVIQRTRLEVEEGGSLFFVESVAPGRVASGEVFQFHHVAWETDLLIGEKLRLKERYQLRPEGDSLAALRALHPASYYAACIVVLPPGVEGDPLRWFAPTITDAVAGASALGGGAWIVKILAPGSVELKAALRTVRAKVYELASRRAPDFRRT